MSATNSQLQLETYFLKELSYSLKDSLEAIPEAVTEINLVGLKIGDLTTLIDENQQKWRCELTIKSDNAANSESFYKFKIVMVGFFSVNSTLSPENAKILAESNCPAVLYSTSREIIATVTRRSPYPAVLLPLVTFVKNIEEPKSKRKPTKKKSE